MPWTTTHIGFGCFRLEDLKAGELFARFDGSLAKVCTRQMHRTLNPTPRALHLPDHIAVWIDYDTSNAARVFLHRTARVHALSIDQARTIAARIRRRRTNR